MNLLVQGLVVLALSCLVSIYAFGASLLEMMLPFGGFAVVFSVLYFIVEDIKQSKREAATSGSIASLNSASSLPSSSEPNSSAHTDDHSPP